MTLLSSDRALLDGFRRGDSEALARVYGEYAPLIGAFLSRGFTFSSKGRTLQFNGFQQPFDLENALQETFVRALSERARLSYDGISPYRNYLIAIARNFVLSELRRREITMSQLFTEEDPESGRPDISAENAVLAGSPAPTGEAELMRRELIELVARFREGLGSAERAFFQARFEERLIQVEAGRQVGISHMQARTLEKKLRKRFLNFMRAQGYLEHYRPSAVMAML